MFKKVLNNIKSLRETLKNPDQNDTLFRRVLSSKYLAAYAVVSNVVIILYFYPKYNTNDYRHSYTRAISRRVGKLMHITIPTFLREPLYNLYIKTYNVNRDEIEESNLKSYKNFQEFFIRKIKVIIF
jgi:hypothetical protein